MTMTDQKIAHQGRFNSLEKKSVVARCVASLLAVATIAITADDAVAQKLDICGPATGAWDSWSTAGLAGDNVAAGWLYDFSIGTFVSKVIRPDGTRVSTNLFTPSFVAADKEIVENLKDAATTYSTIGFNPPILRCYQDAASGDWLYTFHYETMPGDHGEYLNPSRNTGTERARVMIDWSVQSGFGAALGGGTIRGDVLSTPAHELFHAVQESYPMIQLQPSGWVSEGMADAFAHLHADGYHNHKRSGWSVDKNDTRDVRFINYSLHSPKPVSPGMVSPQEYGTSIFWEFLISNPKFKIPGVKVETPPADQNTQSVQLSSRPLSLGIIKKFLNMSLSDYLAYEANGRKKNVFAILWLDRILVRQFNKAIKVINDKSSTTVKLDPLKPNGGGLGVVYPKFAAWLLNQADPANGKPDLVMMDSLKRDKIFEGGCQTATVPTAVPTDASATLTIKVIGSVCLKVMATSSFWVHAKKGGAITDPERLHAGWDGNSQIPTPMPEEKGKAWRVEYSLMSRPPTDSVYLVFSNVGPDLELDTVSKKNPDSGGGPNAIDPENDIKPKSEHEFEIYLSSDDGSSRHPPTGQ
jgi:hypothetical protein